MKHQAGMKKKMDKFVDQLVALCAGQAIGIKETKRDKLSPYR